MSAIDSGPYDKRSPFRAPDAHSRPRSHHGLLVRVALFHDDADVDLHRPDPLAIRREPAPHPVVVSLAALPRTRWPGRLAGAGVAVCSHRLRCSRRPPAYCCRVEPLGGRLHSRPPKCIHRLKSSSICASAQARPASSRMPDDMTIDDQPGSAPVSQIRPQPVQRDRQPVAAAAQKHDVRRAPQPPCERTRQPNAAEFDDSGLAANRREAAQMAITERRRFATRVDPCVDQTCHVAALLLGGRRQARHRSAIPGQTCRGIANRKDTIVPRHRQIAADGKPPGTVSRQAQPAGRGRRSHAGGPQHRARRNAFVAHRDALFVDVQHAGIETHIDAQHT